MDWNALASEEVIAKTTAALKRRAIEVMVVEDRAQALSQLKELIPPGAEVMPGASTTLNEIGFTDYLKSGQHPYRNLMASIVAEKDAAKQMALRRQSALAEYFVGSVHAIAQSGEVVVASATGSQQGAYAYDSPHVIWVAGSQKISPSLELALRRLREYVFPLEDQRMKRAGYPGSVIGKILIVEQEFQPGRITLILVKERLGF